MQIRSIFEIEGEAGFRAREAQVIDEPHRAATTSCSRPAAAWCCEPENRALLAARGFVIYLRAQPRDLYQRTRHDKSRPLLQTGDPLARLEELYACATRSTARSPTSIVDTGRQSVAALVGQLLKRLPEACKLSA